MTSLISSIPEDERNLIVARYLGGDLRMCQEICAIRQVQEKLKIYNSNHPLRIYGKMVEMMKPRDNAWLRAFTYASQASDSATGATGARARDSNDSVKIQDIIDAHGYYVF